MQGTLRVVFAIILWFGAYVAAETYGEFALATFMTIGAFWLLMLGMGAMIQGKKNDRY